MTQQTAFIAVEREIGMLNKDISILPIGERVADQTARSKPVYVLQRWCTKFMTFVDVRDKAEITDGTRLTVSRVTCLSHNSEVCTCS